jgi:hypothetical protein
MGIRKFLLHYPHLDLPLTKGEGTWRSHVKVRDWLSPPYEEGESEGDKRVLKSAADNDQGYPHNS